MIVHQTRLRMPKKPYVQTANAMPQYDEQTRAFIQSAKQSIANNHGLAIDRDPAEIMRENNKRLHEAAQTMASKQGMVKQQRLVKKQPIQTVPPVQPVQTTQPIPTVLRQQEVEEPVEEAAPINDAAMNQVGYDSYMQSLMEAPEDEVPETEMVELSDIPQNEAVQSPVQNFTPNFRQPPREVRYDDAAVLPKQQPKPTVAPKQTEKPTQIVKPVMAELPRQQIAEPPRQPHVFPRNEVTNFSDLRGLPSEGMLYDLPFMGQSLTFMDILMLNHMDNENITTTVNTLFERRINGGWDDGFNASNVLQCDEAYMMHWLRASTIEDPLPYVPPTDKWEPYKCPDCGKVAQTAEDYKKIQVFFNNMDFKIRGNLREIVAKHANGCYSFYLADGRQCDVYLRRRYHEEIVNETLAQYLKDTGKEMPFEMQVLLHSAVIVEIQGIDNIVDKINYLGNLGYAAAKHFLDEVDGASLTTDITAKIICPFCKKEVTIPYPFRLDVYISGL